MEKQDIWLWLALATKGRSEVVRTLLSGLGSVEEIYAVEEDRLVDKGGVTKKEANVLITSKEVFDAEAEWDRLERAGIKFVSYDDDDEFPGKLRVYKNSPMYLFYKGTLPKDYMPSVAMVGARACSNYGRTMAKNIATDLSANGVQVISGLARGIDTYSHLGALEGKTPTFAVLGCGVDRCYPTENIETYEEIIAKGGGIISEYPPGTKPLGGYFPLRNRIISGLADKVAVIEAKEKSGSFITVEWALEQGKDIYAMPGRIGDVLSEGCNRLIKIGAGLLTCAEDILEDLQYDMRAVSKSLEVWDEIENDKLKIYATLSMHPKSLEMIMKESNETLENVMGTLFELQMAGMVQEISKNYFVKV